MSELKANTVMLNLGAYSSGEKPEPDAPSVMIDGVEIHNVHALSVSASHDSYTRFSIVFDAKIGGLAVQEIIRGLTK